MRGSRRKEECCVEDESERQVNVEGRVERSVEKKRIEEEKGYGRSSGGCRGLLQGSISPDDWSADRGGEEHREVEDKPVNSKKGGRSWRNVALG
jgi:hypothetical protein